MKYDVIIIGAGQAGLSMGYYLQQTNLSFLILEKGKGIGEDWKSRYDSLKLFTPRSYSSLPGLTLDGNQSIYPTKNEIAEDLSSYVETFRLPVQLKTEVQGLFKASVGFRILTDKGQFVAKSVVIATGPFQNPVVLKFSNKLSENILQLHSSQYKNSEQLREGPALVVSTELRLI